MKIVIDYHKNLSQKFGVNNSTGFSPEGQRVRFEVIRNQIGKGRFSILDYGCNTGQFMRTFRACDLSNYMGIDINPEFIAQAKKNFPGYLFLKGDISSDKFYQTISERYSYRNFDYAVASGVFCYNLGPKTEEIYAKIIQRLWDLSKKGFIFNVLRKSGNKENFIWSVNEVMRVIQNLKCKLYSIIADYRENDMTIVMRKSA